MEDPAWDNEFDDSTYDFNAPTFTDFDDELGEENDEFEVNAFHGDALLQKKQDVLDVFAVPDEWLSGLNNTEKSAKKASAKKATPPKRKSIERVPNDENSMVQSNVRVVDEIIFDTSDAKENPDAAVVDEIKLVDTEIHVDTHVLAPVEIKTESAPIELPLSTPVDLPLSEEETTEIPKEDAPEVSTVTQVPSYLRETEAHKAKQHSPSPKKASPSHKKMGKSGIKKPMLTKPITPFFSTRLRSRGEVPLASSTTQELQEIARQRDALRQERQKNKELIEKLQSQDPSHPFERKPLTKPLSPKFSKTSRSRLSEVHETAEVDIRVAPKPMARAPPAAPVQMKITQPEPFNLRTEAKSRVSNVQAPSPYVPMAEKLHKFQTKTPARFRGKPQPKPIETSSFARQGLTQPVEPHFATDARLRSSKIPSKEERDEEEMSAIPKFKALPLNRKILTSAGDLGVPKIEKKQPCVPQEFKFKTDARVERRASVLPTDDHSSLSDSKSASEMSRRTSSACGYGHTLTTTQPFHFSTENRARSRPSSPRSAQEEPVAAKPFKARPMPKFDRPVAPVQTHEKKTTVPQPFNFPGAKFHEAGQEKLHASRLQAEVDTKVEPFKAQPIPDFHKSPRMHHPSMKPLTDPKTPVTLARSIEYRAAQLQKLFEQEKQAREAAAFHARPLPVSTFEKPKSPTIVPKVTEPEAFELNSDMRALQRAEFDRHVHDRMEREAYEHEREVAMRNEQEAAELREYRRSLVVKAKPVPDYVELSNRYTGAPGPKRELTVPESPFLLTKQRGNAAASGRE